jgi:spore coat polysaccharide biosynthesis predicted glycosyltransferase SpsG
MEERERDFPKSDLKQIMPKLRQATVKEAVQKALGTQQQQQHSLKRDEFVKLMKQATAAIGAASLSAHEWITVARRYRSTDGDSKVDQQKFLADL